MERTTRTTSVEIKVGPRKPRDPLMDSHVPARFAIQQTFLQTPGCSAGDVSSWNMCICMYLGENRTEGYWLL